MKVSQLQSYLKKQKIGVALFFSLGMEPDPNVFYFTGYEGAGCVIIPANSPPTLFVPAMEYERAKKARIKRVKAFEKKRRLFDHIGPLLKRTKAVGIDGQNLSVSLHATLKKKLKKKYVDISLQCVELRRVKTNQEVQLLKKSCSYADTIIKRTLNEWREFRTEADVAAFLRYQTYKRGLDVSFPPIVASGKNGSMAHCMPENKKIQKGLCVIDFGVKYKGYCSDITRTVGVKSISKKEKEKYRMLLDVQKRTIEYSQEESSCEKVYQFVVDNLKKDARYFTHGLGHGVGVEIHELPNLTLGSKNELEKNTVFTIEPGVYYPNTFGIRIEDTVCKEKKKVTRLTKTTKELLCL